MNFKLPCVYMEGGGMNARLPLSNVHACHQLLIRDSIVVGVGRAHPHNLNKHNGREN